MELYQATRTANEVDDDVGLDGPDHSHPHTFNQGPLWMSNALNSSYLLLSRYGWQIVFGLIVVAILYGPLSTALANFIRYSSAGKGACTTYEHSPWNTVRTYISLYRRQSIVISISCRLMSANAIYFVLLQCFTSPTQNQNPSLKQ